MSAFLILSVLLHVILNQFYGFYISGEEMTLHVQTPATLRHIRTGCKTSLFQGITRSCASGNILEERRNTSNALPPLTNGFSITTHFVRTGKWPTKTLARVNTNRDRDNYPQAGHHHVVNFSKSPVYPGTNSIMRSRCWRGVRAEKANQNLPSRSW